MKVFISLTANEALNTQPALRSSVRRLGWQKLEQGWDARDPASDELERVVGAAQ